MNGFPIEPVVNAGMYRLPGGWWLELGLQLQEDQTFLPFCRAGQGSSIGGPWMPASIFAAMGGCVEGFIDLAASGLFVPQAPEGPKRPRLLDALGGALPESAG